MVDKAAGWAKPVGESPLQLRRLNIGPRLTFCFLLIVLVLLLANGVLIWQFHQARTQADRLSGVDQELITVLQAHTSLMSFYERLDLLAHSENTDELVREVDDLRNALLQDSRRTRNALSHLPLEVQPDPALLPTLWTIQGALPSELEAITVLAKSRDWEAVRLRLANQIRPLEARSSALVANIDRKVGEERTQALLNIGRAQRRILLIVPITGAFTLLFAAFLGLLVTRSITRPLRQLMEGSAALARGDFSHRVPAEGNDEFARLGGVFNNMIVRLQELYRELQIRESYLAEAQKLSQSGSFGWRPASDEIVWSEETYRIFALDRTTKPTGELVLLRTHPEDRHSVQELIDRATREAKDWDLEHRIVMPDGAVKHLHVVAHATHDEFTRGTEYVGAVMDITERKRAEAALRRSAEQLAAQGAQLHELFEQAPEGIVLLDVEDRVLQANPEFTKIFGYSLDEAIGHHINDLIAPEELRSEAEEYTQRLTHGRSINAETIRRAKDGRRIHVSLLAVPISLPGGQIAEYAIYRDISEQKMVEGELARQKAQLNELFETIPEAIVQMDLEDVIIRVNPEFSKIFGYSPEEAVGRPLNELVAPGQLRGEADEFTKQVTGRGETLNVETIRARKDGSLFPVSIIGVPVSIAGGQIGEYGIYRDITERKRGEKEMRKLASLVENSTDFIGFASLKGEVLFINGTGQGMVGLAGSEQVRETKIPDYIAEQNLQRFQNEVLPAVFRDGRWEGETLFKHFQTGASIPMWQHIFFITEEGSGRRLALATICRDITERKQAEGALRRSERQLRDVIETIPAMAWTASPDGSNDFANGKWLEYTGMTVEGTSGDGWKSAIHPSDLEAHWKLWSESLVTGKPFENEARLRRAEHGEYRWFLFRAVPLRDEFGQIVKWYGTGTDIEDRKLAEHTLLVSEARFAEAQRLGHTGSWAWNRVTNHTYWSEETFRIYGFPLETTPSRELFQQHVHPDDLAIVEAAADLLLTKDCAVCDFRLLLPDNSLKYIHSVAQAVKDVNGQVIEFQGTAIDVTELRRAEQELQQLVDLVPQVIVVLEADGTFIHANQFAQEYTGLTFDEYTSKDLVTRIIHPEDELKMRSVRERALRGTEPFGLEVRLRGKDGVYRWFLFRYNPLLEQGRVRRWYASATEIESRKQEEERVRKENVLLEERTRIAQELHDTLLQNFLGASMQLGAAMASLPSDSLVKPELDGILELMEHGIEDGRNAIEGLRSPDSRTVDLVLALSGVQRELAVPPDVEFRVNVGGRQQPIQPPIRQEIYRIGREALVNAFRHSGAKRVELDLEYTDSNVRMRVRDNGCGIDPQVLDTGREGHWGLQGMRERASRLGANLELWSRPGAGTEVRLVVPTATAYGLEATKQKPSGFVGLPASTPEEL